MKNILITGGAGFIGSAIVGKLYNSGKWNITVLDLLTEQIHGKNPEKSYLYNRIKDKCNFIKGDICDIATVEHAVSDNEYIIHLASETGTGQSMYKINQYNKVNIMGTSNLFQVLSDKKQKCLVKKVVLSSSRSVYGEGKYKCPFCGIVYPNSRKKEQLLSGDFNMYCDNCNRKLEVMPTTEDSIIKPSSVYALTKYIQEKMFETLCPVLGIDYTIFRFQNVYGTGQSLKNPYTGILSVFSALMLDNKPVNIFEDGLESRDFINVKDIAAGVINSLEMPESNGEIINLGSGSETTVIEIANILKKAYGSTSIINITGDFRIGDIAHNKADITKASSILNFQQTVSLEEGLNEFCHWVYGQDRDNSHYESSLSEMESAGMFVRNNSIY